MGNISLLFLLKYQLSKLPPVPTDDLTGKTIIVTGGNAGLGYESVKHFSTMNPGKIIIACRSKEKGDAAVQSRL